MHTSLHSIDGGCGGSGAGAAGSAGSGTLAVAVAAAAAAVAGPSAAALVESLTAGVDSAEVDFMINMVKALPRIKEPTARSTGWRVVLTS